MASNNSINVVPPFDVDDGGTGVVSTTVYALQCGGTTTTAPIQSIPVGDSGQSLTSNGAGVLPSFQRDESMEFISTTTISSSVTEVIFTNLNEVGATYMFYFKDIVFNDSGAIRIRLSTDNGSTFIDSADYQSGGIGRAADGVAVTSDEQGATKWRLTGNQQTGSEDDESASGILILVDPYTSNPEKMFTSRTSFFDFNTDLISLNVGHSLTTSDEVNGLRFYPEDGEMTSGSISLFKLPA